MTTQAKVFIPGSKVTYKKSKGVMIKMTSDRHCKVSILGITNTLKQKQIKSTPVNKIIFPIKSVFVFGLSSQTGSKLNGKIGVITRYNSVKQRCVVQINNEKKIFLIRPNKLEYVQRIVKIETIIEHTLKILNNPKITNPITTCLKCVIEEKDGSIRLEPKSPHPWSRLDHQERERMYLNGQDLGKQYAPTKFKGNLKISDQRSKDLYYKILSSQKCIQWALIFSLILQNISEISLNALTFENNIVTAFGITEGFYKGKYQPLNIDADVFGYAIRANPLINGTNYNTQHNWCFLQLFDDNTIFIDFAGPQFDVFEYHSSGYPLKIMNEAQSKQYGYCEIDNNSPFYRITNLNKYFVAWQMKYKNDQFEAKQVTKGVKLGMVCMK
eukprot:321082_1